MAAPKLDTVAAAAVDLARAAAEDAAAPSGVGEHLGVFAEAERVVTHRFAAVDTAYRGWEWTVVLARVSRARVATVSEVVLLPGAGALVVPAWVPWAQRIAPGDLGDADVLPHRPDDPLLDPGFEQVGDSVVPGETLFADLDASLLVEIGLGRERVLNVEGRAEAAVRWYRGASGPDTPTARASAAPCSTCGYLVGMAGSLRTMFGVCSNAWSPEDGRVVSYDHGCGAHSETGLDEDTDLGLPLPLIDQLREELDTEPLGAEPSFDDLVASSSELTPAAAAASEVAKSRPRRRTATKAIPESPSATPETADQTHQ